MDIYLMGIGGTGMGAMAGLLKQAGHQVRGSDQVVYSPMKEKLADWGISFLSPYQAANLAKKPDVVIVGNVIRKDNPEAVFMREMLLVHESFPSALKKLFLAQAQSIVVAGTHGKTTCTALLSHTLYQAGRDPGFLIGGIPLNFTESFRSSQAAGRPFVVEGDEYDTAYFDKGPKFMHYDPKFLLVSSIEFDHADIYPNLDAIIKTFSRLMASLTSDRVIIYNADEANIKTALECSKTEAHLYSYGDHGDYQALHKVFSPQGLGFSVDYRGQDLGRLDVAMFGHHNLANSLACYALLHQYGLSHQEIAQGFKSFLGVKRRLEEIYNSNGRVIIDDFAHHPSAVRETVRAARQKYPNLKLWAVFEPRSASSCLKIFEADYERAFGDCDRVIFAPIGRVVAEELRIDTKSMVSRMNARGHQAKALDSYQAILEEISSAPDKCGILFMSNGNFGGILKQVSQFFA